MFTVVVRKNATGRVDRRLVTEHPQEGILSEVVRVTWVTREQPCKPNRLDVVLPIERLELVGGIQRHDLARWVVGAGAEICEPGHTGNDLTDAVEVPRNRAESRRQVEVMAVDVSSMDGKRPRLVLGCPLHVHPCVVGVPAADVWLEAGSSNEGSDSALLYCSGSLPSCAQT